MISMFFISFLIIVLTFIIIGTGVVLLFGLNMIYVNLKTLVPWVKTPANNLEIILELINLPPQSLIYDLGCGDGRFLFLAERRKLKAIGYELALYPYLKAKMNKFIKGSQVIIKNQDFFQQDLKDADAIFIFLTASVMKKISEKLKRNLRPETLVISYGFEIPGWNLKKVLETKPSKTYIY